MNPLVTLLNQANLTLLNGYYQTQDPALTFEIPQGTTEVRYRVLRGNVEIFDSTTTAPTIEAFQDANDNLVDGSYTVIVDIPGSTYELNLTIDTEAPENAPAFSLVTDSGASGTDRLTNNGNIELDSVLQPGETVTYLLKAEGSGFITYYDTLEDLNAAIELRTGDINVEAFITDAAGNEGPRFTLNFDIDRDAPDIPTIEATGPHENVTVSTQEGAFNVFRYRLASADPDIDASWTGTGTSEPANLPDGDYVIEVRAVDLAGNASEIASIEVTVDRVTTLALPTAIDLAVDTGTSTTDNISKEAVIVFEIDDGASAQFQYPGETVWRDTQLTDLEDGTYTVKIRQVTKDEDGTVTAASEPVEFTFTLDTAVAALVLPETIDLDVWNALPAFNPVFTGYETGAVIEYSLDGTTWNTTRPGELEVGDNFFIRQTDLAGNVSATDEVELTGDTEPTPEPVTISYPENGFL